MSARTLRRIRLAFAWAAVLTVAGLLLAGCGASSKAGASGPTPGRAAASSARAAEHAEATSSGGQAVKKTAAQIADECKPAGGWQVMYPGVPGAKAARKTFIKCEKIPRAKVFAWGLCVGKAYANAPSGGAPGTPAEDHRQTVLAGAVGTCTKTARGTS